MPGHMNVLRPEVPDQVFEMEDINGEFGQADVAIILGANDVVEPGQHVKGSPITACPSRRPARPKTVIVKQALHVARLRGLDNELFHDGPDHDGLRRRQKVVEEMVKAVE